MQTLERNTAAEERPPAAPPLARRTRRRLLPRGDMALAVLALSPSILAVGVFIYGFIGWTFYISTVNWNDILPDYTFTGARNWVRVFTDERFQIDLRNLVYFAASFMTQCIVLGFLLAALLDRGIKGEALFRTVFIFPFAVSGIVTGVAWRWLMQPTTGINLLLDAAGLGFLKNEWYAHPQYGMLAVSIPAAWQMTGYIMALYLAGLRGISAEVREAAAMDGASTFQLYRHVIIPMLAPVTLSAIVLTGMGSIRVFDLVSAMSGSGAAYATDTLAFYMFQMSFQANRFSLGAVIAAFMILLSAFLVVPYLMQVRKEVEQ
ncbi:MAG TPA: sugar ABC transporter permease [Roseiflexaceae bacterium]|nr:sugar ABC transporter permease [Roseiflexaceae bacterium]